MITYPARGRTCSPGPEILALGLVPQSVTQKEALLIANQKLVELVVK